MRSGSGGGVIAGYERSEGSEGSEIVDEDAEIDEGVEVVADMRGMRRRMSWLGNHIVSCDLPP